MTSCITTHRELDEVRVIPSLRPRATPVTQPIVDVGPSDNAEHQARTARLGMWLFLATEVMMFGGLFCLYAVFRGAYPDVFRWGHGFLDVGWGLINTVILLLSSFTMVMAVQSARAGQRQLLGLFLVLTTMCGVLFLGVKVIEYEHKFHDGLLWAGAFSKAAPPDKPVAVVMAQADAQMSPALMQGKRLFEATCAACHGRDGFGLAGMGLPLAGTRFAQERSRDDLVAFLKTGRTPGAAGSQMNLLMPPRGGNASLTDRHLGLIVDYLRTLEAPSEDEARAAAVEIPRTLIPDAAAAPRGVASWVANGGSRPPAPVDHGASRPKHTAPPARAGLFFSLYFLTTGLHAIHMIVGLGVLTWLLRRTWRGEFSSRYHTPVEIGGLYWHLVDMVWLLIFPLFYLVH